MEKKQFIKEEDEELGMLSASTSTEEADGLPPLCSVTSLTRNRNTLGPYSRTIPRLIWWCGGGEGGGFL